MADVQSLTEAYDCQNLSMIFTVTGIRDMDTMDVFVVALCTKVSKIVISWNLKIYFNNSTPSMDLKFDIKYLFSCHQSQKKCVPSDIIHISPLSFTFEVAIHVLHFGVFE